MNFDLGRMRRLARLLGDPQDRFPAVHIAGTNGKGSVASMVSSALRRSKLRTGLYTSPHLQTVHERFQIDGRCISDADLRRYTARVQKLRRSRALPRPTEFEALTAVAFLWFAEQGVDVAVCEVGLGGRLDATNVLSAVAVSVITNIGLDHMAWLGRTPEKIAAEKAGIVRAHVPVVTAATGAALGVIRATAAAASAPLTVVTDPYPGLVALRGPHQKTNAAVAREALRWMARLGFPVTDAAARAGIAAAAWPGRFERFTLKAGQSRITLVLDGAHNQPAAAALAAALRADRLSNVTFIFGALNDKDTKGIAKELAPLAERVVTVTAPSDRAAPAATLARLSEWKGRAVASTLEKAIERFVEKGESGTVVITGSLYVVGAAREMILKKAVDG